MSRELPVNRFTTTAQGLVPAPGQAKGGFLRDDGTWQSISGFGTTNLANPTAKVGLAVVNGVATTAMRSDAAPPIDLTISPTWTGNHSFSPASGVALAVTGNAASQTAIFNGPTANSYCDYQAAGVLVGRIGSADSILVGGAAGNFGITSPNGNLNFGATGSTILWSLSATAATSIVPTTISTGTNLPLQLTTSSNAPWAIQITRSDLGNTVHVFNNGTSGVGNGQWYFAEPVNCQGGLLVAGVAVTLPTTGSFTAGTTGLTLGSTCAAKYTIVGNSVTLYLAPPSNQTSISTVFTITGLPAAIQPATQKWAAVTPQSVNNSITQVGMTALVNGSVITLCEGGSATGWVNGGSKTFGSPAAGATFTYTLD